MLMANIFWTFWTQQTFTSSKFRVETLENGAKYNVIHVVRLTLLLTLNRWMFAG